MRNLSKGMVAAMLLLFGATACADLEVTNLNDPDASRALQSAGDVESLIAGGFENWHDAQYQYTGPALFMSNQSFQHTSPWANAAMEYYGRIPRNRIENDPADVNYALWSSPWAINYSAMAAVADGLRALENPDTGVEEALGSDASNRLRAYGKFVQGMALGSIAILYDQAFIVDETTDLTVAQDPVGYMALMDAALGYLDEAITFAGAGFGGAGDIPAAWMSVDVSADQLARLAYSHKARFAANVARTPAERAAADWTQIASDAADGITEDWVMDMDNYAGWYAALLQYGTYPGWAQANYFVMGMADQAGNYQRWLDLALDDKLPNPTSGDVIVVTPDTRFVQGSTLAEQLDPVNTGSLFSIPDALPNVDDQWGIASVWKRPDRGTWRWSYYWHTDAEQYAYFNDFDWPQVTIAEMDLLRAEAAYRDGDMVTTASIVDTYRTANGLSAFTGTAYGPTDNASCVPRLPDNTCGDLWEALKWEKRMETHFKGIYGNSWFFDGRGWGDLFEGTPLQFPIPCLEAQTLGLLPCYTFGGSAGDFAAPVSTYAYPDETG